MNNIVKTINKRNDGWIFHYAHFLCDCLFPEIINGFNKFDKVYREKNAKQTIGNFNKMYEDITNTTTIEVDSVMFNKLICPNISPPKKEQLLKLKYIDYFRNFIFSRYSINPNTYNENYPKILLVKRGSRINLVDETLLDKKFKKDNLLTGKERREINEINILENYLLNMDGHNFRALYFEELDFKEQIQYFNNAKIIICAHGAVLSNMFFCKKNTKIIEITCNKKWIFFDNLSSILSLNHIKIHNNNFNSIKIVLDKIKNHTST